MVPALRSVFILESPGDFPLPKAKIVRTITPSSSVSAGVGRIFSFSDEDGTSVCVAKNRDEAIRKLSSGHAQDGGDIDFGDGGFSPTKVKEHRSDTIFSPHKVQFADASAP